MIATLRRLIASLLVICIAVPLPSQGAMLATDTALGAAVNVMLVLQTVADQLGYRDHLQSVLRAKNL